MRFGATQRIDSTRERANPVAVSTMPQPIPLPAGTNPATVRLLFWLAFPLALGLFAGWNRIGVVAPYLPLGLSFLYWLIMSALMWAGVGVGTWIIERLTQGYIASPVVVATLGAPLGVLLTRPVNAAMQRLFAPLAGDAAAAATLYPPMPVTAADWAMLFTGNLPLMLFWVAGVALFANVLGYTPFRTGTAVETPPEPLAAGPFVTKLARAGLAAADVVQADDHYVRVVLGTREELLLHRFADAAEELEAKGWARVHRSYCIRADAVRAAAREGRTLTLTMASGARVPVSERHQALALRLAARP
jgi:LytTr DNA-binding domain